MQVAYGLLFQNPCPMFLVFVFLLTFIRQQSQEVLKLEVNKLKPAGQMWVSYCFVNKVLLKHSHALGLHIVCGCCHTPVAELSGWDRDCTACKT